MLLDETSFFVFNDVRAPFPLERDVSSRLRFDTFLMVEVANRLLNSSPIVLRVVDVQPPDLSDVSRADNPTPPPARSLLLGLSVPG